MFVGYFQPRLDVARNIHVMLMSGCFVVSCMSQSTIYRSQNKSMRLYKSQNKSIRLHTPMLQECPADVSYMDVYVPVMYLDVKIKTF